MSVLLAPTLLSSAATPVSLYLSASPAFSDFALTAVSPLWCYCWVPLATTAAVLPSMRRVLTPVFKPYRLIARSELTDLESHRLSGTAGPSPLRPSHLGACLAHL